MLKTTTDLLRKGYILLPKILFEEQIKAQKGAASNFDAFLLVLMHANYSTVECRVNNHTFLCCRGESVLTLAHWAQLFGWEYHRTRYFFNKMFENGIFERLHNPYTTHIRIPDYDALVARNRPELKRTETDGITFEVFWKQYHEVTGKFKINIGRARREWKKLSAHERSLALANIDEYYYSLTNTKFCVQAASYLSDKAFLNQYND